MRFEQKTVFIKAQKISHISHSVLHMFEADCSFASMPLVGSDVRNQFRMHNELNIFFSSVPLDQVAIFTCTSCRADPNQLGSSVSSPPDSIDYLLAWWEASQNAWQSFLLTPLDLSVSVNESNTRYSWWWVAKTSDAMHLSLCSHYPIGMTLRKITHVYFRKLVQYIQPSRYYRGGSFHEVLFSQKAWPSSSSYSVQQPILKLLDVFTSKKTFNLLMMRWT